MAEEDKINEVRKIKDNILRHTSLLSGLFNKLALNTEEQEENIKHIKREFNTIIKETSLLNSFCSNKGKKHISKLNEIARQLSLPSRRVNMLARRMPTDYWIALINGLEISDAKYPFEITGGLSINWEIFEGYVKAKYQRKGYPGGSLGAVITIIMILILVCIANR